MTDANAESSDDQAERGGGFSPLRAITWPELGWLAAGLVPTSAFLWLVCLSGLQTGSQADWFAGVSTFGAVVVALVQTARLQSQAKDDAAEADRRLQRELTHARALHAEEMASQRALARLQRVHLLEQQQKQAVIEVVRAVKAHAHGLATLWSEGARVLKMPGRNDRQEALTPTLEQLDRVVNDLSVALDNAHVLIENEELHLALNEVQQAALDAAIMTEDVRSAVVGGTAPHPNPIPPAQRRLHETAGDARHLAWEVLRTGYSD